MPDMFAGDTAPGVAMADDSSSLLEQVKLRAAEVTKSFMIDMWLARITHDKVMPRLAKVIEAAKDQYAESVKNGDGIYAVGYCVGGRFVLLLAKESQKPERGDEESAPMTIGPQIKAGAMAHAASVSPDDFKDLKAPVSLVCVEHDPLFPDEVRTQAEDIMSNDNVEHEVQVYPGVPHGKYSSHVCLDRTKLNLASGFAVVGEYEDASIKDAQATAYEQMLKWIKDR